MSVHRQMPALAEGDLGEWARQVATAAPWLLNSRHKSGGLSGVYFIQMDAPRGPIKIGHATSIQHRMRELQIASPWDLSVVGWIPIGARRAMRELEEDLHRRFSKLRMRGEWFRPEPELMAFIFTEADEP